MKKPVKGEDYYYAVRDKIYNQLAQLPQGTIKKRLISGHFYYYLQRREGKKVIHQYIGKEMPRELKQQMQQRKALKGKLGKVQDAIMGCLVQKIRL